MDCSALAACALNAAAPDNCIRAKLAFNSSDCALIVSIFAERASICVFWRVIYVLMIWIRSLCRSIAPRTETISSFVSERLLCIPFIVTIICDICAVIAVLLSISLPTSVLRSPSGPATIPATTAWSPMAAGVDRSGAAGTDRGQGGASLA